MLSPASKGAHVLTGKLKSLGALSYPCYIETAILEMSRAFDYPACGLVFSDGVTYGAGAQVIAMAVMSNNYVTMARYTNWTSRAAYSDLARHGGSMYGRLYLRLCWEAENVFSSYISPDGVVWWLLHDSVSHSLTPTHFGISQVSFDGFTYDTLQNFAYFRARAGAPVNG
jgi:hypothetical protein